MLVADWDVIDDPRTALSYVEHVRNSQCVGGTEEVLPVHLDYIRWSKEAAAAMRMSNLLTKMIVRNGNSLEGTPEEFLFDLVRNNVDDGELIFGSAIAFESYFVNNHTTFCPYAFRKDRVYAKDLSLSYNYLETSTEWYTVLRETNWTQAKVSENQVEYR